MTYGTYRNQISRRTMLVTAAAMTASPALAEDCRIGPPAHEKGPRVWMDLDQVELDAAYDQALYAPLRLEVLKRLASNSELVRARLGQPRRESYGPSEFEKLDIYLTQRVNAPIFVFIHGGAWLGGEARIMPFQPSYSSKEARITLLSTSSPSRRLAVISA
jgi:arylformamidase